MRSTCAVPHCGSPALTRGWCNSHYQAWYRYGDPLARKHIAPRGTIEERLRAHARIGTRDECWPWQSGLNKGYGHLAADGKLVGAHRLAYEVWRGPIPEGLYIDHLCRNRACINPWHMEPVTNAENTRRGSGAQRTREYCATITHCPQGHEYTAENTFYKRNQHGYLGRNCKLCKLARKQRWRSARRAAGLPVS